MKKIFLISFIYLICPYCTYAANLPSELIGTWAPSQDSWGKGSDERPTKCDANPSTGNNTDLFYGFFSDGELAAGNPMGAQCKSTP